MSIFLAYMPIHVTYRFTSLQYEGYRATCAYCDVSQSKTHVYYYIQYEPVGIKSQWTHAVTNCMNAGFGTT